MNNSMYNLQLLFALALVAPLALDAASLNVVNPNTVVGTVNTGVNPTGIAISSNGAVGYVVNSNLNNIAGQSSVTVFNPQTNLPIDTIFDPSFNQPSSVTLSPDGSTAYVTNSGNGTISMINTATNSVVGTIPGFDGPSGIAVSSNGMIGYVTNFGASGNGKTVSVVNLATHQIIGTPITVGQAPTAVALSPNGSLLYTVNNGNGNAGTGSVSVINPSNNMVVGTINGFSGPSSIVISPDGSTGYVTNFGNNSGTAFGSTISVVNLKTNAITGTIDVGIQPSSVAISPDGRFLYVTNYNTLPSSSSSSASVTPGQGTVDVIDTTTGQIVATVPVGNSPSGIAISPNGQFADVTNTGSNTVSAIALQSFQISAQGCKIIKHDSSSSKRKVENRLTITATGSSLPQEYAIYRNGSLEPIAVLPATHKVETFVDKHVQPNKKYTYSIVGVNSAGTASAPVMVTVKKDCKK